MNYYNNLALTVTGGLTASHVGNVMNFLQGKVANGGRDSNCKFFYDLNAGGSILHIVAKGVVGGIVSELKDDAVNAFNSILNKKQKRTVQGESWVNSELVKQEEEIKTYGKMEVSGGTVYALDDWGETATEALMLGIELEDEITIKQSFPSYQRNKINPKTKKVEGGYEQIEMEFRSSTLVWYDTTALITINSDKNLVITKVTGRDYSRKELISNGDIKFSVSGQITSKMADIYPEEEMKKFYKVMQYKGIVRVNNQVLDQLGINQIIIENFSVSPREGCKSIQNYTFSAIGLQPENEIEIQEDSIKILKPSETQGEDKSEWGKLIENTLEGLKGMASDVLSQGLAIGTGYLDNIL